MAWSNERCPGPPRTDARSRRASSTGFGPSRSWASRPPIPVPRRLRDFLSFELHVRQSRANRHLFGIETEPRDPAKLVAEQILDVLAGRSARYAVNAPLLTPETAKAIAPYLPLAEMLGRFFAQFCRTGVTTLTLEIAGEPVEIASIHEAKAAGIGMVFQASLAPDLRMFCRDRAITIVP